MIHDCKILQQDGLLSAKLPQRSERDLREHLFSCHVLDEFKCARWTEYSQISSAHM
jgi:hypothetical protein